MGLMLAQWTLLSGTAIRQSKSMTREVGRHYHPVVCANIFRHHSWTMHDDVINWKYYPRYWLFVWGIHRSPVNSPLKGQWRRLDVFFYLRLNKRLSKQSWGWWFEMPSHPLWRHYNDWEREFRFNSAFVIQFIDISLNHTWVHIWI